MKILVFCAYYEPEVASSMYLITNLLEGLSEAGYIIELFTPTPTRGVDKKTRTYYTKYKKNEIKGNLHIHRINLMREGKNPISRAFRYIFMNIIFIIKALGTSADVIFVDSTPPTQGIMAAIIKKIKKIPFIYNLQDIFPDSLVNAKLTKKNGIIWKIGRMVEDYTYKNADKIIVISESMKKNILNKGVLAKKIKVVSNWIDINSVCPILRKDNFLIEKLGLKKEEFLIVYAGNFGAAQGTDIIFEVAKQLEKIDNLKFVLFGGGAYFEEAKQKAENMKNVIINKLLPIEYVSQVYSLGNIALITCKKGTGMAAMPSKTWSIMACNTPIIASFDVDSELSSILEKSGSGVCVEAENAEKLKIAIEKEYKDFTLGVKRKVNSREYVKKYASKEVCVNKYINVIIQENRDILK